MQMKIITTVVTPATATAPVGPYDLTTLATVKAEQGITDSSQDTILQRYITGASIAAMNYCNRVFAVETVKDQLWPARQNSPLGSSFEIITLSRWPVISIASMTDDGTALTRDTDYVLDPDSGQLSRLGSSGNLRPWHSAPKVVQYSAGYATVPSDVEDAVIRMVTSRYLSKDRDALVKGESVPGVYEAQYWVATGDQASAMTPDVIDLLDNYRVPLVG